MYQPMLIATAVRRAALLLVPLALLGILHSTVAAACAASAGEVSTGAVTAPAPLQGPVPADPAGEGHPEESNPVQTAQLTPSRCRRPAPTAGPEARVRAGDGRVAAPAPYHCGTPRPDTLPLRAVRCEVLRC